MSGLQGKKILFGVTGSIAAFKAAEWVRFLVKEEALVTVIMTRAAEQFITPLTFAALTGNPVYRDMFADDPAQVMAHIQLSREADVLLIAPATAQTIARLAHGVADDLLATVALAAHIPIVVCPAMNTQMYLHQATQRNLLRIQDDGCHVVAPGSGTLACGEVGEGRLSEWEPVREKMLSLFTRQDLTGYRILLTAGPTREPLDPVRYLSNRSSGKMGFALARTALRRGARVTLVSGPVNLPVPPGVDFIPVTTAQEMADAVLEHFPAMDIVVKAAAVADFKPESYLQHKIKKSSEGLDLHLHKNLDILKELGARRKAGQFLVGFAAESRNHIEAGREKLQGKNVDLMVVNDILGTQTGFDVETNQVTLIDSQHEELLPLLSKENTADRIWDRVLALKVS